MKNKQQSNKMKEKINNLNNNVLQFDHNEWFLDD